MDLSLWQMDSKDEEESEDNSPTKVRRRNLSWGIGMQSQGAFVDVDKSPSSMHLASETSRPQLNESKPEVVILSALNS
jgi:hypothetical protein